MDGNSQASVCDDRSNRNLPGSQRCHGTSPARPVSKDRNTKKGRHPGTAPLSFVTLLRFEKRLIQFIVKYLTLGWSSGSTSIPTPSVMPQFNTWWWIGI